MLSQFKQKVFISYVKENTDKISLICRSFRQNDIEYWLDRNDIAPGTDLETGL